MQQTNKTNNKLRVILQSFDHHTLESATSKVTQVVLKSGGKISGPVPLKTKKTVVTINRSTFVHSKAKEKLESRIHKRLIDIFEINNDVVSALTSLALPSGVDITINSVK
jgi:small subunit ribosomal protein S10